MTLTVTVINPWSAVAVERDVTELTEEELDGYAQLMDEAIRERLHDEIAPCSPGMFLKAWADEVGPIEAGRVILGS